MTPFVASPRSGPEPFLPPLADTEFLIALLAEVTNQDPGTVRYRYEREKRQLGSNVRDALVQWGLQPYVWDDRLSDFYSQTDAFLFETLVWNQHPVKVQMRQWMGEFFQRDVGCAARVLTFGDGLGVDSLYLAQLGHAVDYFEVSQPCARFAQALGARLNTTLNLIDSKEKLAPRAYDVVVCLDVLEHVPDPAKLVEELSGWLRPAG
ncbi:MAG: class I SAM-dependent methyltransferase, partial [Pirellulaceae bacterium]